jgi:enolase
VSSFRIQEVQAWEVLDSRGMPTVACEVTLIGGHTGYASVPSGASTGTHEARELRDGGARYGGRGVARAVDNVRQALRDCVVGLDASNTSALDAALRARDGSADLGRLGANAVLAVSLASTLAAAEAEGVPLYRWLARDGAPLLPLPMVNIISGGAHAEAALDLQDFLVVPVGAESFAQALEWCWRVRHATAAVAAARGLPASLVADEGGLGPPLASNRTALELLSAGIERSGLRPAEDVAVAIDVAATQLFRDGRYHLSTEGRTLDADGLIEELLSWCSDHPVVSVEDALSEDDWEGWGRASKALGHLQVLGDDLFVTNAERLARGISAGIANAVLVKVNQNGTLSGAEEVLRTAAGAGYATVVSARSGDTEDAWLADLAVGWAAGQIKVGSTMRSERTAKWNRLLRIEAELGEEATFAGRSALGGASAR